MPQKETPERLPQQGALSSQTDDAADNRFSRSMGNASRPVARLLNFLGHNRRVRLGQRALAVRLVIERAAVLVRVSMRRAEDVVAAALEPRQPDLLRAASARGQEVSVQ